MELEKVECTTDRWCNAFPTILEASSNYPSSQCTNCHYNQFNYEEGISTCSRLLEELKNTIKINREENYGS